MIWMSEDFERESKKKKIDSKKSARLIRKALQDRQVNKEKQVREQKVEVRRKANNMSKMV
jgi:hypothetical protein